MSAILGNLFVSNYRRSANVYVERAAYIALLCYAFFWLCLQDVSQTAESVILLLFVYVLVTQSGNLRHEPMLYLVYAWLVYQLAFVPWVIHQFPDTAADQIGWARHYAKLALIIVVAWWLGGDVRNIVLMLALVALGFLIGVTFRDGGVLDSYEELSQLRRPHMGYTNSQHISVYAAFTLMVLLTLRQRIAALFVQNHVIVQILIFIGIFYSSVLVILMQTRATWLGLLVAFIVGGTLLLFVRNRPEVAAGADAGVVRVGVRPSAPSLRILLAAGIVISLLIASGAYKVFEKRIGQERDVVSVLLDGDIGDIQLSSVGIRVLVWRQGLEWFMERPVFGWGPKTRTVLFMNGELPEDIPNKHKIRHFHNQPLELAVGYGLVGITVFALALYLIVRTAYRAWRDGRMPFELLLFGAAFLSYWIVVNMFESYFNYSTGAYINALIGGAFFTFRFTEPAQGT